MSQARVYRTDISVLRPVERRGDGTIRVDAFLSKCGVFQYWQPDGTIRKELRLPEDVLSEESLRSFEGVPVTNNHPPGMLDAKNARQYAVGAVLGVPIADSDHIRGRLSVFDHGAVGDMEGGKVQVSNGYTCDTEEKPGIHPLYGAYDAIQRNIRGNHVAIVDRARAGITASARMDADRANGMMVLEAGAEAVLEPGMQIAVDPTATGWHSSRMAALPTARVEVVVKNDAAEPSATAKVDPDDLASRNAAGKTSAKPHPKDQPGEAYEDDGNDKAKPKKGKPAPDDDDDVDDDDDDDDHEDMYDSDGKLTEFGKKKIDASTFALPEKKQLPMHSPEACKDSMKAFAKHQFDDAGQKHRAFNLLKSKAGQFGMHDDASRFDKKHASKLDSAARAHEDEMTPSEIKALQEKADKADKRKEKLVKAKARIDELEAEVAERDATIENLKRDQAAKKDGADAPRLDDAEIQKRADAKVELLDKARQTGAQVESKMSDLEIMRATVKHVDGDDVPEAKAKDASYVQALFDGALKRAKKDAADTDKGNAALAAARAAVETNRKNTSHADAGDEEAAKAKLRAANRELISQPSAARRHATK